MKKNNKRKIVRIMKKLQKSLQLRESNRKTYELNK